MRRGAIVLALLVAACSAPVDITQVRGDPGHEDSPSGLWCWNGTALPAPHRYEYRDGTSDHPCTPEELAANPQ